MACLVPTYCCSLLIGRRLKCCCCSILQIDEMEGESEGRMGERKEGEEAKGRRWRGNNATERGRDKRLMGEMGLDRRTHE